MRKLRRWRQRRLQRKYIRQVGDFIFTRSDRFKFDPDEVTFRGKWRDTGK